MASSRAESQGSKKVAIVFVQLGENPSPTLISSAKYAQITNPNSRLILITDQEKTWKAFPGEIISAGNSSKKQSKHIVRKAKYLRSIAGGYWVNTYERIFALSLLDKILDLDTFIVHIESDVLIQSETILKNALQDIKLQGIGVPRMNKEQGIASILVSPSYVELNKALSKLEKLATEFPDSCSTDMNLLGLALNSGIISELPVWKNQSEGVEEPDEYFFFEGAAVGQYLFGLDPIHTSNTRISGYLNPEFPINLSSLRWATEGNSVYAYNGQERYWFTNLHIHSKEILLTPLESPKRWSIAISEANLEIPRTPTLNIPEVIHSSGYSLLAKLEIFVREKSKSMASLFRKKNS
ncbi:hypothetical protein MCELANE86_00042 [Candidatus Nanopelagicaceae bacterium]